MNDTTSLEQRLAALEDRQAILDLMHAYTHATDYALEDEFLDMFTDDATWEAVNQVTGTGAVLTGHEQLRGFIHNHTRPPELFTEHVVTSPNITARGDVAEAKSYLLAAAADPATGLPHLMLFGRYLDTMRRCEDGKWRFTRRIAELGGFNPTWSEWNAIRKNAQA